MVTQLTGYNTQRYTLNSLDDLDGIDFHNGDQVLLMDLDKLFIFDEENVAWYDVPAGGGGGGGGSGINVYSFTYASNDSVNAGLNALAVPQLSENEILIINIKGSHLQGSGNVGVKFQIDVVQGGDIIINASGHKNMSTKTEPDNATPSNTWGNGRWYTEVVDGKYHCTASTIGYVGAGNTIECLQISYNVGWNV